VNDVTLVELQRTRAKQVQFKQFSELMGKRRQVIFLAFSPLNTDLVVETITLILFPARSCAKAHDPTGGEVNFYARRPTMTRPKWP
jgi:hypothetical protein